MDPHLELPEDLHRVESALLAAGVNAREAAWDLLRQSTAFEPVQTLKNNAQLEGDQLERLLLWHAAQQALPRIPDLPIHAAVASRLTQDLRKIHAMKASLEAGSYHYDRAAKMATLQRFPAGPMEWEISGIPRSYFLKADFPANLRLLAFVLARVKGRAPCFFMHIAPSPRNRGLSIPKQVLRSYYQMVRSMQMQPEMRALLAHAWFHDPAALRDHPQLETLNQPYLEHGGLITLMESAPPESGVLEGNASRAKDYISGKIQYRYGFAVWPREAALRWAAAHPELDD